MPTFISHFPDLPPLRYQVRDSGWYRVKGDLVVPTGVKGFSARYVEDGRVLLELDMLGNLTIREGFEWDGATKALDTESILYAALVHDALYKLLEHGLSMKARLGADREFMALIRHYAATAFRRAQFKGQRSRVVAWFICRLRMARAAWCYLAVRLFGRAFLKPGKVSTVIKRIVMTLAPLFFMTGCAGFLKTIQTVDDVAVRACEIFFTEQKGMSLTDAVKTYCRTREVIDRFAAGQEDAGEEVVGSFGLPAREE